MDRRVRPGHEGRAQRTIADGLRQLHLPLSPDTERLSLHAVLLSRSSVRSDGPISGTDEAIHGDDLKHLELLDWIGIAIISAYLASLIYLGYWAYRLHDLVKILGG